MVKVEENGSARFFFLFCQLAINNNNSSNSDINRKKTPVVVEDTIGARPVSEYGEEIFARHGEEKPINRGPIWGLLPNAVKGGRLQDFRTGSVACIVIAATGQWEKGEKKETREEGRGDGNVELWCDF